jgi:hypothetical protein
MAPSLIFSRSPSIDPITVNSSDPGERILINRGKISISFLNSPMFYKISLYRQRLNHLRRPYFGEADVIWRIINDLEFIEVKYCKGFMKKLAQNLLRQVRYLEKHRNLVHIFRQLITHKVLLASIHLSGLRTLISMANQYRVQMVKYLEIILQRWNQITAIIDPTANVVDPSSVRSFADL